MSYLCFAERVIAIDVVLCGLPIAGLGVLCRTYVLQCELLQWMSFFTGYQQQVKGNHVVLTFSSAIYCN